MAALPDIHPLGEGLGEGLGRRVWHPPAALTEIGAAAKSITPESPQHTRLRSQNSRNCDAIRCREADLADRIPAGPLAPRFTTLLAKQSPTWNNEGFGPRVTHRQPAPIRRRIRLDTVPTPIPYTWPMDVHQRAYWHTERADRQYSLPPTGSPVDKPPPQVTGRWFPLLAVLLLFLLGLAWWRSGRVVQKTDLAPRHGDDQPPDRRGPAAPVGGGPGGSASRSWKRSTRGCRPTTLRAN